MKIREIENIIDHAHEEHSVFKLSKKQATFNALETFEDVCRCVLMGSIFNPFGLKEITDQMDALNEALIWIDQLCVDDPARTEWELSESNYNSCLDLLKNYAYPYCVVCSGYISYSRDKYDAFVDGNCVTFNLKKDQNQSAFNDILRETSSNAFNDMTAVVNEYELLKANTALKSFVKIEDGKLCYSLTEGVIDIFRKMAERQWDMTKTLPETWEFEQFTMKEYKQFWVAITALCYIHLCAGFSINDGLIRINNGLIIQSIDCIIDYITNETKLENNKVLKILNYIKYDPGKKNVDIMYQPIVHIDDKIIITPMLFMGSRPERNILAVISTMNDSLYSKEVNELEGLMVSELETFVNTHNIVKHKHLRDDLPDVDFAILDEKTNSAMICETKWFAAADSTKEVYAKEDEITHGCRQVEDIMAYAMFDKKHFFKQVFNYEYGETIDLFCCVVAKHNIRTQNKYVPVIDLKTIENLFSTHSLNDVFHIIRNHEYEVKPKENIQITHQEICYGGFKFLIPAICFST